MSDEKNIENTDARGNRMPDINDKTEQTHKPDGSEINLPPQKRQGCDDCEIWEKTSMRLVSELKQVKKQRDEYLECLIHEQNNLKDLQEAVENHIQWLKENYVMETCEQEHFPEKDCISCQAGVESLSIAEALKKSLTG